MKTLRIKIFSYFLLPVILLEIFVIGTFSWRTFDAYQDMIETDTGINAIRTANNTRDLLAAKNYSRLTQMLFDEKYVGENMEYLAVYDEQGKPIARTSLDDRAISEIDALDPKLAPRSYYAKINGEDIHNIDLPLFLGLSKIGYLRIGQDFGEMNENFYNALYLSTAIGLSFIALIAILAFYLSRSIIRPVENLSRITREYSFGKLSARSDYAANDEIGVLAADFNNLADSLEKTNQSLVAEKKKLQTKVSELEIWQKNTIDRELKMIELKEEIKRLKEEGGVR